MPESESVGGYFGVVRCYCFLRLLWCDLGDARAGLLSVSSIIRDEYCVMITRRSTVPVCKRFCAQGEMRFA